MQATIDNLEDIYELSPMQEGMLFHTLQAPASGVYVEQLVCTIRGTLDHALFNRAWQLVVDRHPVLRTAFVWEGLDRPRQVVRRTASATIDEHDWRALGDAEQRSALDSLIARDRQRGFALDRAPLMRITLARAADDRTLMVWSHHHLLLDGWSVPIVLQEAATAYGALTRGEAPRFPDRRLYRDYIVWLRTRDRRTAETAWRAELAGAPASTPLPMARPATTSGAALATELRLTVDETRAIDAFTRVHGLTLNTTLLGAWALLLGAYAGEDDVVCGSSVSGRPADLEGADAMVGLFINSLPARVRIDPRRAVSQWLQQLQARQAQMRQHDATPLVDIQGWLGLRSGAALFDSLLVVVNYPVDAAIAGASGGLTLEAVRSVEQTSMPLTVFAVPGEQLAIKLASDRHRYDEATLASLASRLRTILINVAADGTRAVGSVPLVDDAEAAALIEAQADPKGPALRTVPVGRVVSEPAHEQFEAQAARQPDAPAVMYDGAMLTYHKLNERANRLARHLRDHGARPGSFIALAVDRGLDLPVGMLAIMKCGSAYVPLDPSFPPSRLAFMFDCANVSLVVSSGTHAGAPWIGERAVVDLSRDAEVIARYPSTNPGIDIDPASIAYVMFTSGSTGAPKGAALPHSALSNLLHTIPCRAALGPGARMAATTTAAFDLSLLELSLPLVTGATMVIFDRATAADGRRLANALRESNVTVLQGTPSLWRLLLASGWNGEPPLTMITGGEPLTAGLAADLLSRGTALWNLYGPTETTIYSTGRRVSAEDPREAIEPIGTPLPNQPQYVVDHHGRLAPRGLAGELLIGGAGLAHGYVGRPDLSAERFVPDPFGSTPGSRLYRTGDVVRARANGEIEYIGRNDFQLKVRGYRVEAGEIESAIAAHPGVRECVLQSRAGEAGDQRLVAYITGDDVDVPALRASLRTRLPEYMVPAAFVALESFPRLGNGKIDRVRLPDPGFTRPQLQVGFEPPATDLERAIAALWQDVLKIDRVGANDNFFDVGGHSLFAVRLFGKLRDTLGRDLSLVDLFSYPTVRTMARYLSAGPADDRDPNASGAAASGRGRLLAQRARRREAAGDPAQDR